ncbi:MAG TPA: DUF1499 domain-containing protein [Longimicrobiaceae bacterium]|nr:DUF1499 domain-containing protein [Longimicrobiaceae bacterium]
MRLPRALRTNRAYTHPESRDPRLRGRTYDVAFARVWEAALAEVERRKWKVLEAKPVEGEIHAEARTRVWKFTDDVWIRLSLDPGDGRTRVDMVSASRVGTADLGTNARRIARFLHALDRRLRTK